MKENVQCPCCVWEEPSKVEQFEISLQDNLDIEVISESQGGGCS